MAGDKWNENDSGIRYQVSGNHYLTWGTVSHRLFKVAPRYTHPMRMRMRMRMRMEMRMKMRMRMRMEMRMRMRMRMEMRMRMKITEYQHQRVLISCTLLLMS